MAQAGSDPAATGAALAIHRRAEAEHLELKRLREALACPVVTLPEIPSVDLGPGEVAHIPKGVVHATFNPTDADAVILAILSPAAATGPFLVDVSHEEPWRGLRP